MEKASGPVATTDYYATGVVKSTGFTLDGAMHGEWRFFRLDGSLMRSGSFERDRQVGTWRTFDRTGRVVKETTFKEPGGR